MKRKGPTTFFLKSQVSHIQKVRILQESFELNKLCMIDW